MKFELEESLRGASDEELLEDMRCSAKALGKETITIAEYEERGKAHPSTIQRRFGSWVKALKLAGLQPSRSKIGITDDELFENIKALWISLGRQPRYNEVRAPNSRFSARTYENRFGSWSKALGRFVAWVNSDSPEQPQQEEDQGAVDLTLKIASTKRRARREISDRQRFRILVRDGFRCKSCGRSPLSEAGVELHVDHILPWSKGGETNDDNLEIKCKRCNLGKGNAFNV
ncbi:MAG: HNH endonuclease [Nitrosomonadales bacterium]|nr:HNH endonuclease [Nitrosomonadales bacterium]